MESIVGELLAGNREHAASMDGAFDDLQDGQTPAAVTVCCSDSRVLQNQMWKNETPGRIFTVGNIGNRVIELIDHDPMITGDVLYPLAHTQTRVALVIGHTACGAITGAYEDLVYGIDDHPGIKYCLDVLENDMAEALELLPAGIEDDTAINYLVEYNVDQQIRHLLNSPVVPDDTRVLGGVYDFCDVYPGKRGEVHLINIDGERDVTSLRDKYPAIADRIRRLWTDIPRE